MFIFPWRFPYDFAGTLAGMDLAVICTAPFYSDNPNITNMAPSKPCGGHTPNKQQLPSDSARLRSVSDAVW